MKRSVFFLMILFFLVGCVNDKDKSRILKEELNAVECGSVFSLSNMVEEFDSIYIVKPYDQDLPLDDNIRYDESLKYNVLTSLGCPENINILLFVAHGEVISYAKIDIRVADFSGLGDNVRLYPHQSFSIDDHRDVHIVE